MKEEQKNTLVHAINHFGVEGQINKAMEEMGELITELARRNSSRYDKNRVAEEVADALIMLEQLRIIFGASKVDGYIAEKLERLENTINGDWRRQERMMPKGMVKPREEKKKEKTATEIATEGYYAELYYHMKRLQPRCACLYCKHLGPSPVEGLCDAVCNKSGDMIIGNVSLMCCGRFEPTIEEKEENSHE